jgi:hypothetical protein
MTLSHLPRLPRIPDFPPKAFFKSLFRRSKGFAMQRADGRVESPEVGIQISISQNLIFVLAGLENGFGTGGAIA